MAPSIAGGMVTNTAISLVSTPNNNMMKALTCMTRRLPTFNDKKAEQAWSLLSKWSLVGL